MLEVLPGPACAEDVLAGLDPREQLGMVALLAESEPAELERTVLGCPVAVRLNFAFWARVATPEQRPALQALLRIWKCTRREALLEEWELARNS